MKKDNPSKNVAKSAKNYFDKGRQLDEQKDHSTAISTFDKAIRLDPNYVEAYNRRGTAKYKIGQYIEAISDYDEAISLEPN
ncbi:tetratricopeptide repeat protein [Candidatus Poribacteria bacterium]|nr:tetratricopeptide repeat protein [Candidatus Poribacteria bacterium]